MARPREFEMDKAIQDAMYVFWEKGYEGTSLPDLLAGMSISRGSLYKAFEDKKKLYLMSLQKYDEEEVAAAITFLEAADQEEGLDKILSLFNQIIDCVASGDRRGCLVCSASAASYDGEIKEAVQLILIRMRNAFEKALENSCAFQKMNRQEIQQHAELITIHYVGLRVLARSHAPVESLKESIQALEKLLKK